MSTKDFRFRGFALCLRGAGFKRDRAIDLRFSKPTCRNEYKHSGNDADDHAADQEAASQEAFRYQISIYYLVAGKSEKVAAVVNKLMNRTTVHHARRALLRADEVDC
jgi:hypothetical protein